MRNKPQRKALKKAFTLVEILIVVVILGILAAIVIPQFTSATEDSQSGNLRSQLSSLQRQIELFRAQQNRPFAVTANNFGWEELVTSIGGRPALLREPPVNPAWPEPGNDAARTIVAEATFGSDVAGWVLNNGVIYASYFRDNPASSSTANFRRVYTGAFTAGNE